MSFINSAFGQRFSSLVKFTHLVRPVRSEIAMILRVICFNFLFFCLFVCFFFFAEFKRNEARGS